MNASSRGHLSSVLRRICPPEIFIFPVLRSISARDLGFKCKRSPHRHLKILAGEPHRSLTSIEPHYFIVLNTDPLGDEAVLLATTFSQIESIKRRRGREPASTVVEIAEADYADFTKDSVIDCSNFFTKSLLELCDQWRKKKSFLNSTFRVRSLQG